MRPTVHLWLWLVRLCEVAVKLAVVGVVVIVVSCHRLTDSLSLSLSDSVIVRVLLHVHKRHELYTMLRQICFIT